MNASTLDTIQELGPWFHNIHLPDGTQTAPEHFLGDFPNFKWQVIGPYLPRDLQGWSALDIGCNAGFYSVELARRGAQVLAIDIDNHYLRQAQWVTQLLGLQDRITLRQMQVYDLTRLDERFDLVLFMGVMYHLRYPLLGLDIVSQKVKRLMVFQTLLLPGDEIFTPEEDYPFAQREILMEPGWPRMAFVEKRFAADPTNWWVADRACFEAMLRSSGMIVQHYPEREMAICAPDSRTRDSYTAVRIQEELSAATGRSSAPEPKN